MKRCTQARDLFGPYWDDEITQAEREWLESHFTGCPGCRREYDALARTLDAVATLPREEAVPDLAERALARARRATPATDQLPARSAPGWIPLTAGAALVIAALGVVSPGLLDVVGRRDRPLAVGVKPADVAPRPVGDAAPGALVRAPEAPARPPREDAIAALPDTLFDHSEDVEFILEPVQVRRGRALASTRLPNGIVGEQAVITF